MNTCANPGCDQPGTEQCSACKTTPYCGLACQTADWNHHKEECPGHLLKVGKQNLAKANIFYRQEKFPQMFKHADLALTKLRQMKDCPVEEIDGALAMKSEGHNKMGRYRDATECSKQRFCLNMVTLTHPINTSYITNIPYRHAHIQANDFTHPHAILASFTLIDCCVFNNEYFDAELYARTTWETLTLCDISQIPEDKRQGMIARGAIALSRAILGLAKEGGFPPEKKQQVGQEAIMLARKALEMNTQCFGNDSFEIASDLHVLASVLDFFDDFTDDEIPRLIERSTAIYARVKGRLTLPVALGENNLGVTYQDRGLRAHAAHDLDRFVYYLKLALSHYNEASRIYRAINEGERADDALLAADDVEEMLRQLMDPETTAPKETTAVPKETTAVPKG